jgi:hypothetical protein
MFRQPAPRKEPVLRSVDSGPRPGEPALRREEPVLREVLVTTTPTLEGRPVGTYLGVVAGQSLMEAGLLRERPKGLRRLFRKGSFGEQDNLSEARDEALRDLTHGRAQRAPTRCSGCGSNTRSSAAPSWRCRPGRRFGSARDGVNLPLDPPFGGDTNC